MAAPAARPTNSAIVRSTSKINPPSERMSASPFPVSLFLWRVRTLRPHRSDQCWKSLLFTMLYQASFSGKFGRAGEEMCGPVMNFTVRHRNVRNVTVRHPVPPRATFPLTEVRFGLDFGAQAAAGGDENERREFAHRSGREGGGGTGTPALADPRRDSRRRRRADLRPDAVEQLPAADRRRGGESGGAPAGLGRCADAAAARHGRSRRRPARPRAGRFGPDDPGPARPFPDRARRRRGRDGQRAADRGRLVRAGAAPRPRG